MNGYNQARLEDQAISLVREAYMDDLGCAWVIANMDAFTAGHGSTVASHGRFLVTCFMDDNGELTRDGADEVL